MSPIDLYVRVLRIVEYFLDNAAHLSLNQLQNYDPSIDQLAQDIRKMASIISALASCYEDENMAINARQCCVEMEKLAIAVRTNNDEALNEIFRNLEMHTRVPA